MRCSRRKSRSADDNPDTAPDARPDTARTQDIHSQGSLQLGPEDGNSSKAAPGVSASSESLRSSANRPSRSHPAMRSIVQQALLPTLDLLALKADLLSGDAALMARLLQVRCGSRRCCDVLTMLVTCLTSLA